MKKPVLALLVACLLAASSCSPEGDPPTEGSRVDGPEVQGSVTVVAVADIACAPDEDDRDLCRQEDTAEFQPGGPKGADVDLVIMPGDLQYEKGKLEEFMSEGGFDDTWGPASDVTFPVPGNHEYGNDAEGYFDYWESKGRNVGERDAGYYSFDAGEWHLIGLNSSSGPCKAGPDCDEGSDQNDWLESDLANSDSACTLAFWHHPMFDSGDDHGNENTGPVMDLWDDLYGARADVIVNGHSHNYQRYAPQTPDGEASDDGIAQFVVGTGGKNFDGILDDKDPNFETWEQEFGVLKLELAEDAYSWAFVDIDGEVLDEGGPVGCHNAAG
jgi:acid phosphatase type 7